MAEVLKKRYESLEGKMLLLGMAARFDACGPCAEGMSLKHLPVYPAKTPGGVMPVLKVLFTNACSHDCAYCTNRWRLNVPRVSFQPAELALLTAGLYRRGVVKGLFLSSAVHSNPTRTMERMIETAWLLRKRWNFTGYIHLKILPGAHVSLVDAAVRYADRVSINLECPDEEGLRRIAPAKSHAYMFQVMRRLARLIGERQGGGGSLVYATGQTTQVMVGATYARDVEYIKMAYRLYRELGLKRVYYSPFRRVVEDACLPREQPDLPVRVRRLYQADSLIRHYGFRPEELFSGVKENLPLSIDPKTWWALRNPDFFPVELSRAGKEELLRVPGIGPATASKLLSHRNFIRNAEDLKCVGVDLKRAGPFSTWKGKPLASRESVTGGTPARKNKPYQGELFSFL